ncbi:hypothetical protein WICPIJ_007384 [Wickerhamomyces pijperi]|uniref:Phosphoribomutase n=1 Tax=Wickerhamomyces pijperi TaxID=599730 RepID=A0A9P8Q023_WICPI|nr:hypothetical protein WICPIJ_007384 [Wickerhamomyces pijperi]
MSDKTIDELVLDWLKVDPDPTTRKEIIDLQLNGDNEELEKRLRHRITFGTAGLRSKMEAGFNRLNQVTIMQASQGLASYVISQPNRPNVQPTVVVGHDHRLNSKTFAEVTVAAFLLKGFKVYYLSSFVNGNFVPTPLVPYSVDYFKAEVGVMITASHNPAQDNGYKVYWGNGCQIIPPHDAGIALEIVSNSKPVPDAYDTDKVFESHADNLKYVKEEAMTAYILHLNSKIVNHSITDLDFVYTPVHGVGLEVLEKAVRLIGVQSLDSVEEQSVPDPYFSTVSFPNPEEKGALDLAINKAESLGVDLVIANDPDADRFSAAVKHNGHWRQLTGNEIGFLFADYIFKNYQGSYKDLYFVNSTVSSQMIATMAKMLKFNYCDTLTGFKWIGNKTIELEAKGYSVPFGFEEAIGFMFEGIHDKDGISAALVFLQMAQSWKDQGVDAIDVLNQGFVKYGYFKEYNSYYIVPNLSLTNEIFKYIRSLAISKTVPYPEKLGGFKIEYWRDLTTGYQSNTSDNVPDLPIDKSSQMITVILSTGVDAEQVRFTMRGSGTEPKLKIYVEAKASGEDRASKLASDVWGLIRDEWIKPDEYAYPFPLLLHAQEACLIPMVYIDAHCHISPTIEPYQEDGVILQSLISKYNAAEYNPDVKFLLMSSNHIDYKYVDAISNECDNVIASFGLHPWYTHLYKLDDSLDKIEHYKSVFKVDSIDEKLLSVLPEPMSFKTHFENIKVLIQKRLDNGEKACIGEIGLDKLFRIPTTGYFGFSADEEAKLTNYKTNMDHQKFIFIEQVKLAASLELPISVHNVKAGGVLFEVLKKELSLFPDLKLNVCLHSYTGSLDTLKLFFSTFNKNKQSKVNIYCSLSQVINGGKPIEDIIKAVPEDFILTETDISMPIKSDHRFKPLPLIQQITGSINEINGSPIDFESNFNRFLN